MQQLKHHEWKKSSDPQEEERSRITSKNIDQEGKSVASKTALSLDTHGKEIQPDCQIDETPHRSQDQHRV